MYIGVGEGRNEGGGGVQILERGGGDGGEEGGRGTIQAIPTVYLPVLHHIHASTRRHTQCLNMQMRLTA